MTNRFLAVLCVTQLTPLLGTVVDIQNEMLAVMADMVRDQVIDDVKQSVYFLC